jgi:hypothetical protein
MIIGIGAMGDNASNGRSKTDRDTGNPALQKYLP